MNSTTIRIYEQTKVELERLMEERMEIESRLRPYTRAEFIDLLILKYKESMVKK